MNEDQIREWLGRFAGTANAKDLRRHLDMISRSVRVFGVPGFEALGYDDWENQATHEFEKGILDSVAYEGLVVRVSTERSVMFRTRETVKGTDGTVNRNAVEMVVQKEEDEEWRLTQQRVLSDAQAQLDQLTGAQY